MSSETGLVAKIPLFAYRIPVVDRSTLERLSLQDDFTVTGPQKNLHNGARRWPPKVTRIPEPDIIIASDLLPPHPDFNNQQTCGTKSCRFLLPLRIAEQESKARIHFLQILQLSRELNRTLVLPNVAKSRLGACFNWDFGTYYDSERFMANQYGRTAVPVVTMGAFERWLATRRGFSTGQIVSVAVKADPKNISPNPTVLSTGDLVVNIEDDRDPKDLPNFARCLMTKFKQRITLDSFSPLVIHPVTSRREKLKKVSLGALIVDGLSLEEIHNAAFRPPLQLREPSARNFLSYSRRDRKVHSPPQPDVLILNWDLRQPAFPPLDLQQQQQHSETLDYSPQLVALATRLAPAKPYLAVHWRMETVPPGVLPSCAVALVETLADLLRNDELARGIRTVWFATDYMYPVSRNLRHDDNGSGLDDDDDDAQPSEHVTKSGTFREVVHEHEEAVDILRKAFEIGGQLEGWSIVGLWEALERVPEMEGLINSELLKDAGVSGILDKIIAVQSAFFISASSNCGRASSYTRQVVESRKVVREGNIIRNVVQLFG